jgi:SOS-response transcriptional repressor LexA
VRVAAARAQPALTSSDDRATLYTNRCSITGGRWCRNGSRRSTTSSRHRRHGYRRPSARSGRRWASPRRRPCTCISRSRGAGTRRDPAKPRALSHRAQGGPRFGCRSGSILPLVGEIAPALLLAEQNIDDYLVRALSTARTVLPGSRGEHDRAGILDGDYVIVRRQQTAENGEVVAALVGDDGAAGRRPEDVPSGGRIRLQPENEAPHPLPGARADLAGRGALPPAMSVTMLTCRDASGPVPRGVARGRAPCPPPRRGRVPRLWRDRGGGGGGAPSVDVRVVRSTRPAGDQPAMV